MLRDEMITVFGGSGFIGRYVVRALAKAGYRVRVAPRRPHLAGDMRVAGVVGQVQLVQANLRDAASIARAVDGAHGVVNLVGILFESGKQKFASLQAEGAGRVAEAAKAAGVTRFVQMSAIGAELDSKSVYGRTKAEGEQRVRAAIPEAVVLRPSIVFGQEDAFFNRFADMARFSPFLPLIGGGKTKFQPVFAGDVAEAVLAGLEREDARGRTFELGGPGVYTFKDLMQFILKTIDRKRVLLPLPLSIAWFMALGGEIVGMLPFVEPFLTRDQIRLMKAHNIVGAGGAGLGAAADLEVKLETVEAITPTYLARYRRGGEFHEDPGDAPS